MDGIVGFRVLRDGAITSLTSNPLPRLESECVTTKATAGSNHPLA